MDAVASFGAEIRRYYRLRGLAHAIGATLGEGADIDNSAIDGELIPTQVFHDLTVENDGNNAHSDIDKER